MGAEEATDGDVLDAEQLMAYGCGANVEDVAVQRVDRELGNDAHVQRAPPALRGYKVCSEPSAKSAEVARCTCASLKG